MLSIRKSALASALLIIATANLAFAQVPTRTRLNFTINVPYELEMGGYLLPAGKYVIFQSSQNSDLFALYSRHLAHEPIAMIQTVRVRHWTIARDRETRIMLEIDESSKDSRPVLVGWNVPYADGWEIISVKARSKNYLVRSR